MSTPTFPVQPEKRNWYVIDAQDYTLGRLATRVAVILRGKHKPVYSPHQDHGDHVVVINASKVQLTGKKLKNKTFFRYTGYMGGVKTVSLETMMAKTPEEVDRRAIRGMLPKTRLGRSMIRKLKVYPAEHHPHRSQRPTPLTLGDRFQGSVDTGADETITGG